MSLLIASYHKHIQKIIYFPYGTHQENISYDGFGVSLLSRDFCLKKAEEIGENGLITGMTRSQIACELYFHSYIYHVCLLLAKHRIQLKWLLAHADPIDLSDGGDTLFRRAVFRMWWYMPEIRTFFEDKNN